MNNYQMISILNQYTEKPVGHSIMVGLDGMLQYTGLIQFGSFYKKWDYGITADQTGSLNT